MCFLLCGRWIWFGGMTVMRQSTETEYLYSLELWAPMTCLGLGATGRMEIKGSCPQAGHQSEEVKH
jgi:hypothetical protein